jgi:N-acetylglucosamine-6-phosphate deacetylase
VKREPPAPILIRNGSLVLPDRVVPEGALLLSDRKITYCGPEGGLAAALPRGTLPAGVQTMDAAGGFICPALWEPHIHGCGGTWVGAAAPGNLRVMGKVLAAQGVGVFLPTTVPDEDVIEDLGAGLAAVKGEPSLAGRIPGIYVEGPFVAHSKRGGIPERCLKPVSVKLLDALISASGRTIRVMTFAPELPGALGMCGALRERGILPALGHSDARLAELEAFEDVGLLAITHMFNGMSGVSHRDPGLALWALMHPELYTELICDGVHVHPAAIALALRLRPHDRVILISDAVALAACPEPSAGSAAAQPGADSAGASPSEPVSMYGRPVTARGNGVYFAESGVLVGSRLLVRDGVARLVRELAVPVHEAVAMASLNTAHLFGVDTKGALLPGMDADAAVFTPDFSLCSACVFEGRILHGLSDSHPAPSRIAG